MPDPVAVNSMFARIARRYDLANRLLSGGIDIWWRRQLVAAVRRARPEVVLDLATGSGDVAFALSRRLPAETRIVGMDFCLPMLAQAEGKQQQLGERAANVTFRAGDALSLPLEDGSVAAVTLSFGLRNLADRHRALTEIRRVLRPSGRLFVLEFSQPVRGLRGLYYFYLRRILPPVAGWLTGDKQAYVYLNETIERFPDREAIAEEILRAGFRQVHARALTGGIVALHEAVR